MRHLRKRDRQHNHKPIGSFIQPKLNVGKPGDRFEREADAMADKVTSKGGQAEGIQKQEEEETLQQMPLAQNITPIQRQEAGEEEEVQAKCAACEADENVQKQEEEESVQAQEEEETVQAQEESEEELQTKSSAQVTGQANVETTLKNSKGGGSPMQKGIKSEMESGFGADFSGVRIHTDAKSHQMNKQLKAHAFTHGNDIYFNQGTYNPTTSKGKHLLAHELTHTIQQGASKADSVQSKTIQRTIIQRAENLGSSRFSGNTKLEQAFDGLTTISQNRNRFGTHTRLIQESLLALGYTLPTHGADSDFGPETDTAVRQFQIDAGAVKLDGIVGPETMRLLDMKDSGGTTGPTGPSPTIPTSAVFSEAATETFAGYDASTAPDNLIVPVGGRRRATVTIAPTGTIPTYVSVDPTVATVNRTDDGILVTGVAHGTTTIRAMVGTTVLSSLDITVKRQLDRTVAFHYVSDSATPVAHSSNGSPSPEEMRSLLNRVWHRQTNIRFTDGGTHQLTVAGDLGPYVNDDGFGGDELGTVISASTRGADYNVFRVWAVRINHVNPNGGLNNGNNTFIADVPCADGLGLPHECGHFLGLGHGSGFIMTPCGGRTDQRVSKAMADSVNP